MIKNTEKSFPIDKITNSGVSVQEQIRYFNIDNYLKNLIINHKETERIKKIKQLFNEFINTYSDFKTILSIQDLLSSSKATRSKSVPRPQNAWVLFRKNLSKGLNLSVGQTSGIASYLWKNKSERELKFWKALHQIIKEIHAAENPGYIYKPNRMNNQNIKTHESSDNLEINSLISENQTTKQNDKGDIDLFEVDIDMIDAELYQSSFYDASFYGNELFDTSLYDTSLYDLSLDFMDPNPIDSSFSFIDPCLIDNSLNFS
ncbi:hypothetical protein RclHR1_13590001 [Rhizophagus clarus]|uniref:Mating-type MAT1-1-3 n=1 Tax=Rhizophagus clarus TaxID=94130 RepID=A0A2Z6R2W7_9GLOM|nr:hypothetical protein RclHR1_13590001 [Rhizophagus clarus]GES80710.1 mating-type MAT1-1-3 [Rhizophagus clarus]